MYKLSNYEYGNVLMEISRLSLSEIKEKKINLEKLLLETADRLQENNAELNKATISSFL